MAVLSVPTLHGASLNLSPNIAATQLKASRTNRTRDQLHLPSLVSNWRTGAMVPASSTFRKVNNFFIIFLLPFFHSSSLWYSVSLSPPADGCFLWRHIKSPAEFFKKFRKKFLPQKYAQNCTKLDGITSLMTATFTVNAMNMVILTCPLQTCLTLYSPVVTICTVSLTFSNSTFCPHIVFMCFVWIWEQTATISLYHINWLVFITEI